MNKLKVLIGDNSMGFGVICKDLLTKEGVEVALVPKDGSCVLQAAGEIMPDIVVMESFMAQLDAIGVLKSMKATGRSIPKVIVTSGYDNRYIENEVMSNGAYFYMLKPFDMNDFCDRILSIGGVVDQRKMERCGDLENDLETIVTDVILHVGIPAHIKGYHYIREAIILSVNDSNMINSVTKLLYPTIAKRFDTTSSRVERAIRHTIEIAWDRGDVDTLDSYFGYTINNGRGKPTNSEFIAMISDKLRLKLKRTRSLVR